MTAVITTHVRPLHVYEALASVLGETHADVEVVVVDDGGVFVAPAVDGAAVRVVRGGRLGVGRARNLGLEAARGEFVIFLDDDDVAYPERIARLLGAARQHQADLCFGMTRRTIDGEAVSLAPVPTHLLSDEGPIGFCDLLTCNPHVNAVLVRTEALRAVGGFDVDADHFDDWSAWLRIADRGATIWHVGDAVAEWRIHAEGLSGGVLHLRAMRARLLALFARLEPLLSDENARGVALARQVVERGELVTYDDYVDAAARTRDALHAAATCFGRPLAWHVAR